MGFTDDDILTLMQATADYIQDLHDQFIQKRQAEQRDYDASNPVRRFWLDIREAFRPTIPLPPSLETYTSVMKEYHKHWNHYRVVHHTLLQRLNETNASFAPDTEYVERLHELIHEAYTQREEHGYVLLNSLAQLTLTIHGYRVAEKV